MDSCWFKLFLSVYINIPVTASSVYLSLVRSSNLSCILNPNHFWFCFVFRTIFHWNSFWISTPFSHCKETFQRGQREGKERFTYPYPLFALSLPSLCPLFALSLPSLCPIETQYKFSGWAFEKRTWSSYSFLSVPKIQFRFPPVEQDGRTESYFGRKNARIILFF